MNDISEILFSKEDIDNALKILAKKIEEDYNSKNLLIVGLLKGSTPFLCDLSRYINMNLTIDFMTASSYYNETETTGNVTISSDLSISVSDKHILVLDDIVDTGYTLSYIVSYLKEKKPLSVKTCALLDKPSRRKNDFKVDYKCLEVDNVFVVGYGMDYKEYYRNLPYIGVLKESVYL